MHIFFNQDYSNMPTLCRPIYEGGFGFDYRSAINASNLWQKVKLNFPTNLNTMHCGFQMFNRCFMYFL